MSLYYESHVTIEPVFNERLLALESICQQYDFRIADLLMKKREADTPERSQFDTFCSARDPVLAALRERMLEFVIACEKASLKVWRYKIENVVIDSNLDDSPHRLR